MRHLDSFGGGSLTYHYPAIYIKYNYSFPHVIIMFLDDWLVKSRGFFEFGLLHEEHMRHIEFPHVTFVAKFDTLPENFLHLLEENINFFKFELCNISYAINGLYYTM